MERPERDPAYDRLAVLIGKWINVGRTIPSRSEPPLDIITSDVYEWLTGRTWVLHTAYGRIGSMGGGAVEMIGYDRETGKYASHLYDSLGNMSIHKLTIDGDSMAWRGRGTSCTAEFTEGGKVQTAHHVRLGAHGNWVPAMEVVLTRVI
ncbi:MAG: DUF1579 family protein [Chloroflexota bacterium]